jgi:hypothetical protein
MKKYVAINYKVHVCSLDALVCVHVVRVSVRFGSRCLWRARYFILKKANLRKKGKTDTTQLFSLFPPLHLASPCDTWRARRLLPRDFLAPQRTTCRIRSELSSLHDGRPFFNDFAKVALVND